MRVMHPITLWLCQNSYGKSPFLMGKSTISMAIFNSYVSLPEGTFHYIPLYPIVFPLYPYYSCQLLIYVSLAWFKA